MTNKFKTLIPFLLVALLAVSLPVHAQTTTTTTTLSVALTDTSSSTVVLASGTNVAANGFIYVDKELMAVIGPINSSTTRWTVRRGAGGIVGKHAAAAKVTVAAPGIQAANVFRTNAPSGTCTATAEAYLPIINVLTGEELTCSAGLWVSNTNSRTVSYMQGPTVANAVTTQFFIADKPYVVTGIKAVWGTAETTGAMAVTPEKATGTTACGSATAIATAFDAATTANTVATGALSATAANLHLATGDRLCVKLTATPNEVKDLVVTVTLAPK
jgi:hypothetical protein